MATADVWVRPAKAGDERAITEIQLTAWNATHAELLGPDVLALLDEAAMRASWRVAITGPPGPGYRVLVACDGPRLVGFASVAPLVAPDPAEPGGGLILALEVAPDERRSGHGSRLLTAVVDLLRADGADLVSTWVLNGDDARTRFLTQAGLGPDGAQRRLTEREGPDDGREQVESRWSATI